MPLRAPPTCLRLDQVRSDFAASLHKSVSLLARQTLLQLFAEGAVEEVPRFNVRLLDVIKWSVLEELAGDPLCGWLRHNGAQVALTAGGGGGGGGESQHSHSQTHSQQHHHQQHKSAAITRHTRYTRLRTHLSGGDADLQQKSMRHTPSRLRELERSLAREA